MKKKKKRKSLRTKWTHRYINKTISDKRDKMMEDISDKDMKVEKNEF